MRKNKKGTSTLFLAIILSALILVETTYIAYVADLDRRLTYTRALKEQAEIYLASYNRQLFKTYGIYAFDHTTFCRGLSVCIKLRKVLLCCRFHLYRFSQPQGS